METKALIRIDKVLAKDFVPCRNFMVDCEYEQISPNSSRYKVSTYKLVIVKKDLPKIYEKEYGNSNILEMIFSLLFDSGELLKTEIKIGDFSLDNINCKIVGVHSKNLTITLTLQYKTLEFGSHYINEND